MENQENEVRHYKIGEHIEFAQDLDKLITDTELLHIAKGDIGTVVGSYEKPGVQIIGSNTKPLVKILMLSGSTKGNIIVVDGYITGVDYKGIAARIVQETRVASTWLFKTGRKQTVNEIAEILQQYQ